MGVRLGYEGRIGLVNIAVELISFQDTLFHEFNALPPTYNSNKKFCILPCRR